MMRYFSQLGVRLVLAVVLAVVGSGVIGFNVFYAVFSWITIHYSWFLALMFHGGAVLEGNMLLVGGETIEFIPACIAASAYLLLALLILLTKGISWKKGIVLFVIGSVLILIGNLVRIEILIALLIGKHVNYFQSLHLVFWKLLSSGYVAAVWIALCVWFKIKEIPVYSDFKTLMKHIS